MFTNITNNSIEDILSCLQNSNLMLNRHIDNDFLLFNQNLPDDNYFGRRAQIPS